MNTNIAIILVSAFLLTACAKSGSDEWEDVDYSKIANDNYRKENDSSYTPPTVIGCVDDDLYNCPTHNR